MATDASELAMGGDIASVLQDGLTASRLGHHHLFEHRQVMVIDEVLDTTTVQSFFIGGEQSSARLTMM